MDQLTAFLRPEVLAAIPSLPWVLQMIRGILSRFPNGPQLAGSHAAIINGVGIIGLVFWALRSMLWPFNAASYATVIGQALLAWGLSDLWFTQVVEKQAKSSNPLVPGTPAQEAEGSNVVTTVPAGKVQAAAVKSDS